MPSGLQGRALKGKHYRLDKFIPSNEYAEQESPVTAAVAMFIIILFQIACKTLVTSCECERSARACYIIHVIVRR